MAMETKKNQKIGNTFEEYILERLKNAEVEAATYMDQIRLMDQQIKDLKESRDDAIAKLNALKSAIEVEEIEWFGEPGWAFRMAIYPSDDAYKKVEEILIVEEQRRAE